MALLWWQIWSLFFTATEERVTLKFQHWVDRQPLVLDSVLYRNDAGEAYRVSKCKYYIGRIRLLAESGPGYESPDFQLIDVESDAAPVLPLKAVPAGRYTALSFLLGVDSLGQGRGVQSGALDPLNGMFWTWNTGYIFFKLEGTADSADTPGHFFEYHIGGYRKPANCLRTILIQFPNVLELGGSHKAQISVHVNVAESLRTPHMIRFSEHPSITDFHYATWIADNCLDMFSLGW